MSVRELVVRTEPAEEGEPVKNERNSLDLTMSFHFSTRAVGTQLDRES